MSDLYSTPVDSEGVEVVILMFSHYKNITQYHPMKSTSPILNLAAFAGLGFQTPADRVEIR